MRLSFIAILCIFGLSACGTSLGERSISGAGIGAGAAALIGGDLLGGAAAGAAVGALTNAGTIDLGEPLF